MPTIRQNLIEAAQIDEDVFARYVRELRDMLRLAHIEHLKRNASALDI